MAIGFGKCHSIEVLPNFVTRRKDMIEVCGRLPSTPSLFAEDSMANVGSRMGSGPRLYRGVPGPTSFVASVSFIVPRVQGDTCLRFCGVVKILILGVPVASVNRGDVSMGAARLVGKICVCSLVISSYLVSAGQVMMTG